jgi:hypothetical protein
MSKSKKADGARLSTTGGLVDIRRFKDPRHNVLNPEHKNRFGRTFRAVKEAGGPSKPIRVSATGKDRVIADLDSFREWWACRKLGIEELPAELVVVVDANTEAGDVEQPMVRDQLASSNRHAAGINDIPATVTTSPDEPETDAALEESADPDEAGPSRLIDLADLRPNPFNEALFPHSTSEIDLLAESIERIGQQEAIKIQNDGMVLDGHRRLKALEKLGMKDALVRIVVDVTSGEQAEDYVIGMAISQRKLCWEERANLYPRLQVYIRRRHGRPPGRPRKDYPEDNVFLSAEEIRAMAARAAGFPSYQIANKAQYVVEHGDDETKKKLNAGKLKVTTAYKRLKESEATDSPKDSQESTGADGYDVEKETQGSAVSAPSDSSTEANDSGGTDTDKGVQEGLSGSLVSGNEVEAARRTIAQLASRNGLAVIQANDDPRQLLFDDNVSALVKRLFGALCRRQPKIAALWFDVMGGEMLEILVTHFRTEDHELHSDGGGDKDSTPRLSYSLDVALKHLLRLLVIGSPALAEYTVRLIGEETKRAVWIDGSDTHHLLFFLGIQIQRLIERLSEEDADWGHDWFERNLSAWQDALPAKKP